MKNLKIQRWLIAVCALLLVSTAQLGAQEKKFALVIGNASYGQLGNLKNPINDAKDMASALKRLGFDVELVTDAQLSDMEESVLRFRDRLGTDKNAMGLFFYAGHGIQAKDGTNYLIPTQASISDEVFLKTKALSAQTVLELMQSAGNKLNLVFLDACRDNPFSWSRGGKRGLSMVANQPPGSIIVYATSAGSTAADGSGRNGVFTGELLKNLETPGVDLDTVLNRTAQGVISTTKNEQNPAIYKQYFGTAYLKSPEAKVEPVSASSPEDEELEFGAVSMGIGKLEIYLAEPGTISILGKSVKVPGGATLPVNKIKAGQISIEVTWEDGSKQKQDVLIQAEKTSTVKFSKAVAPAGKTVTAAVAASAPKAPASGKTPPDRGPFTTGKTWRSSIGITFTSVMGGTFDMGSPNLSTKEKPVHNVGISSFYMAILEVTQSQWEEVMGNNPSYFKGKNLPVERITWYDAVAFCNRLSEMDGLSPAYIIDGDKVTWDITSNGYRLPTEAEWEYAARGGAKNASTFNAYAGGFFADETAWFSDNSGTSTHPVGSKKPNALGIWDMCGNAGEWCWDWFGPYAEKNLISPVGPDSGTAKVIRGGSWNSDSQGVQNFARLQCAPDQMTHFYGFRIAASQ